MLSGRIYRLLKTYLHCSLLESIGFTPKSTIHHYTVKFTDILKINELNMLHTVFIICYAYYLNEFNGRYIFKTYSKIDYSLNNKIFTSEILNIFLQSQLIMIYYVSFDNKNLLIVLYFE